MLALLKRTQMDCDTSKVLVSFEFYNFDVVLYERTARALGGFTVTSYLVQKHIFVTHLFYFTTSRRLKLAMITKLLSFYFALEYKREKDKTVLYSGQTS